MNSAITIKKLAVFMLLTDLRMHVISAKSVEICSSWNCLIESLFNGNYLSAFLHLIRVKVKLCGFVIVNIMILDPAVMHIKLFLSNCLESSTSHGPRLWVNISCSLWYGLISHSASVLEQCAQG